MNIMGSSLGFFWRYTNPSDSKDTHSPKIDGSEK
jgi:BASS family bile acid:Na+ symporter